MSSVAFAATESPASSIAGALEAVAQRDVTLAAMLAGGALGYATGDVLAAIPPLLVGLEVLARRPSARALPPFVRLASVFAGVAYAFVPAGDAVQALARFLGAIVGLTLFEGRPGRERGLLFLLFLAQTGLAAALVPGLPIFGVLVATVVLVHRALSSVHRARGARSAAARGGVVLRAQSPRASTRAAHRAAVAVLLLGAVLFPLLPRAEFPLFALRAPRVSSFAGVGDSMRIEPLGPLGDLDAIVGRATPADEGEGAPPPYLRAAAYDRFDGREWTSSTRADVVVPDGERGRFEFESPIDDARLVRWRLELDASAATRLPLPEGTLSGEFADPLPAVVGVDLGVRTVRTRVPPTARGLDVRVVARTPPTARGELDARARRRLTELPSDVRRELSGVVRTAVGEPTRAAAVAARLTEWVRDRCAYSTTGAPSGRHPIEDFLLRERRGHCEYFASALAVCLRCAGVPARVVGGFRPTRWNAVGGFWAIRGRDAHAWVEAFVDGAGWIRLDATPLAALAPDPYEGVLGFVGRLKDAAAQLWSTHVLGFDHGAQREFVAELLAAVADRVPTVAGGLGGAVGGALAALALVLVWIGVVRLRRSRGRLKLYSANTSRVDFYRRALDLVRRRGAEPRPPEGAEEFLARARRVLSPSQGVGFGRVTGAFQAVRYGARPPPDPRHVEDWLRELAESPTGAARSGPGSGPGPSSGRARRSPGEA